MFDSEPSVAKYCRADGYNQLLAVNLLILCQYFSPSAGSRSEAHSEIIEIIKNKRVQAGSQYLE